MEVAFDPQDCDEMVEKPSKWNNEKLKTLWASLLNLEAVSKACDDVELQGILLLLETVFSIFRKLKYKQESSSSSYEITKHELDLTKQELQQVKEELIRCKISSCERCMELEKELLIQKKKQETNENRIKSIVNILSMKNGSEDSESNFQADHHPVVAKAFNLVSQMLLGEEAKLGTKRDHQDSTGSDKIRTPGKKKKKVNKIDTLGLKETKKEADREILIPETLPIEEKGIVARNEIVPETLDSKQTVSNWELNENLETTPKKQATTMAEANSPILGGSNKKPCLNSYINSSPQEDSSDECTLTYECVKMPESKSPSLLKAQSSSTSNIVVSQTDKLQDCNTKKNNLKLETKASALVKNNKENVKKVQADLWKLHPTHSSGIENGNRKLKQTTLSLARYPKKNDLSTLKEFNGGVRQSLNESDSLADRINGDRDDETSLQLAIQESLIGKENMKDDVVIESTEDEDDFVFRSPKAKHKRINLKKRVLFNKKDNTTSDGPKKQYKDTEETFFVPLFTSTMKDDINVIPESPDISSEKLPLQLAGGSQRVSKQDNSFNRIPEKVLTSPNYKYRRNALRKKEDRQKLDGWECEQCKNYYALAGENLNPDEMKQRLKLCSKHRDKYPVCSTTPPGYWDINLLDTEMTRVEDRRK